MNAVNDVGMKVIRRVIFTVAVLGLLVGQGSQAGQQLDLGGHESRHPTDDPPTKAWVYGRGLWMCKEWSRPRQGEDPVQWRAANMSWVLGYITGAGQMATYELADTYAADVGKFMDSYCENWPSDQIVTAARHHVASLKLALEMRKKP